MAGVKCPLPELGCYWRFGGKRTGSVTSRCCDFLLAGSACSRDSDWSGMRRFVIVNTVLGLAPLPLAQNITGTHASCALWETRGTRPTID